MVAIGVVLAVACTGSSERTASTSSSAGTTTATLTTTAPTTTTTAPITTAVSATASVTETTTPSVTPDSGEAGDVAPVTAAQLGASWHEGCPVGPDQLRDLTVAYWGFDGSQHAGHLVVNASVVDAVRAVFQQLLAARFPIRKMVTIDAYGGSDDASSADDNTSAFNCREAVRSDGVHTWSQHAYGLAIDVNDVENPYVDGDTIIPPNGADYVDRSNVRPGMAVPGSAVTDAFAAIGWGWGGGWSTPDYQHFSANGR